MRLTMAKKRALINSFAPRYRRKRKKVKGEVLTECAQMTGTTVEVNNSRESRLKFHQLRKHIVVCESVCENHSKICHSRANQQDSAKRKANCFNNF